MELTRPERPQQPPSTQLLDEEDDLDKLLKQLMEEDILDEEMLSSPTDLDQQLQLLTVGQLSDPWENPSSILSAGNSQHFQLDNSKQPTNRSESLSASQPTNQPAS